MPAAKRSPRTRRTAAQQAQPATVRAVLYARMSLDKLGDGLGLDRQESACRSLAEARGWEVVAVESDVISATKHGLETRPGWANVLRMVDAGEVDKIVVWHLDRLTRSVVDLQGVIELVERTGVGIAACSGDLDLGTDAGRLVGRILASVAMSEGERKAARQTLANEQRAEQGRPMWVRRPFGYERDGTLREDEARLVRQAYADALRGKSLSAIARDFDASGLAPTGGAQKWGTPTIRHLLLAARNAGLSTYYGEVVGAGKWTAIVDESTWRAVERLLNDPARHRGQGPLANLLSGGIATCAICDSHVKIEWRGRKGEDSSYKVYMCKKGCASLPVDFADGVVLRELTRQADKLGRERLEVDEPEDIAPLRAREAELVDRLSELGEAFAAGEINRATMRAGSAKIDAELTDVQRRIADAGRADVLAGVDVEALYYEFDEMDLDRQRAIVRDAFESIKIKPRGRGRSLPKREHIDIKFSKAWRAGK